MIIRTIVLKEGEKPIFKSGQPPLVLINGHPTKDNSSPDNRVFVPLYPVSKEVLKSLVALVEFAEKENLYMCSVIVDQHNNIGIIAS